MRRRAVGRIDKHLKNVTDLRVNRRDNHDVVEMIFTALTATFCGASSRADVERFLKGKSDWFAKFLVLEHGVPKPETFSRVFPLARRSTSHP